MVSSGQFIKQVLVPNQTRLLCMAGVVLLGLYSKFLSQRTPKGIAIGVLLVTSLLEIMQLSRHASLEYVRSFFWGRTLIGTTFAATDFVYYIIGSFLGYFWICWIRRRGAKIY